MPALAVQRDVFRKQVREQYTLYWNPRLTALQPMRCSRCGGACMTSPTKRALLQALPVEHISLALS